MSQGRRQQADERTVTRSAGLSCSTKRRTLASRTSYDCMNSANFLCRIIETSGDASLSRPPSATVAATCHANRQLLPRDGDRGAEQQLVAGVQVVERAAHCDVIVLLDAARTTLLLIAAIVAALVLVLVWLRRVVGGDDVAKLGQRQSLLPSPGRNRFDWKITTQAELLQSKDRTHTVLANHCSAFR